ILSTILTRTIVLHLAAPADACLCHFCCSIQKTLEETHNEQRHMARPSGIYLTSLPFCPWFHGVMVSTLDSESSDPSSNLGGTLHALMSSVCGSIPGQYRKLSSWPVFGPNQDRSNKKG